MIAVPQADLIEFLGVFARFEFALKRAGYGGSAGEAAEAQWDDFARAVAPQFNKGVSHELTAAIDYMISDPPKKQVIDATGRMTFQATQLPNVTELEKALLGVLRVGSCFTVRFYRVA
jgi:hypothetical protein